MKYRCKQRFAYRCEHTTAVHYSLGFCRNCYLADYYRRRMACKNNGGSGSQGGHHDTNPPSAAQANNTSGAATKLQTVQPPSKVDNDQDGKENDTLVGKEEVPSGLAGGTLMDVGIEDAPSSEDGQPNKSQ